MIRVATFEYGDGSLGEVTEFSKGKVVVQTPEGDLMTFESWAEFLYQLLTVEERESVRDLYRREY